VTVANERKLAVFFEAGPTRYALEAVRVTEVARPDDGELTLRGHLTLKDLSVMLGGGPEVRPGTAVVLDSSPTVAVRVREVEGVFDVSGARYFALPTLLHEALAPAVKGAWLREERLVFELDVAGITSARALPASGPLVLVTLPAASGPCLVCEAAGRRIALPLPQVRQVVPLGRSFNPTPGHASLLGALLHGETVCPVFSLGGVDEAFVAVVEVGGALLGLGIARAEGVRPAGSLGEVQVVDLEHTFPHAVPSA
jgi:chemotaxis signal transduction protein